MSLSRRTFAGAAAGFLVGPRAYSQSAGLFQHGVASGDPLPDRVIIWTRVSVPTAEDYVEVRWTMSRDPQMNRIEHRGVAYTNPAFDYTVKVDVPRLNPGTTYYFQFSVGNTTSPIGRTKTAPAGRVNRARFAVTSCSNHPYGFFNAYGRIAARADLDCVLHLGDYIYEYGNAEYGDGTRLGRIPSPNREIVTLADYRQRYSQYRMDPDLQAVHRQHPFIIVWDDHETTNNSSRDGAENHQPATEGDWYARKAVAVQAWMEWQPVRVNAYEDGQIFRTFRYGDLMDLIMLDTRLYGRDTEVRANSPAILDPSRSLLGFEQEAWLYGQLGSSAARNTRWRMLGQQVMMSQLVGADGPLNPDQWDGYVPSRNRLLAQLAAQSISNVVVLTGDIHSSWANEISVNPFAAATATRQAVEFVTPGVTSPGIEDRAQATGFEQQIGSTHPHVRYLDLFNRGYLLVDLDRDRAQAEWYHMPTITERSNMETFARAMRTSAGESRLVAVNAASIPAPGAPPFAP